MQCKVASKHKENTTILYKQLNSEKKLMPGTNALMLKV